MENQCVVGELDMSNFKLWWESHLPSYVILYCRRGEATLQLQFEEYRVSQGMTVIVSPDMFPSFHSRSEDLMMFYCLMSCDFAETAAYGVPNMFYDCLFVNPIIDGGDEIKIWTDLLKHIFNNYSSYQCRNEIMKNVIHNIYLVYYNLWQQQYGGKKMERELKRPEQLCMRFYNLVFDHFAEHRDTKFYADSLCITPNYLAMIVRQVSKESPKDAIGRQVILEMKYILANTTMTAEQMAVRLNFSDTSYMCRYFRKRTGMSISDYRNDCNQNKPG